MYLPLSAPAAITTVPDGLIPYSPSFHAASFATELRTACGAIAVL
ncbi:hypothetical protein [Streptomyces mirabilis]